MTFEHLYVSIVMIMVPGIPRDSSPFSVCLSIVRSSCRSTRLIIKQLLVRFRHYNVAFFEPRRYYIGELLARTTNVLLKKLQVVHPKRYLASLVPPWCIHMTLWSNYCHISWAAWAIEGKEIWQHSSKSWLVYLPFTCSLSSREKNSRISTIVYG